MNILFMDLDETLVSTIQPHELLEKGGPGRNMFREMREAGSDRERKRVAEKIVEMAERSGTATFRKLCRENGVVAFVDDGDVWLTKMRPGTKRFLRDMKSLFHKVCVLTAGGLQFQRRMMLKHGLIDYFDGIYSTIDNIDDVPDSNFSLLVDNLPYGDDGIWTKLIGMGEARREVALIYDVVSKHARQVMDARGTTGRWNHIQVREYHGEDVDDELSRVEEEILARATME